MNCRRGSGRTLPRVQIPAEVVPGVRSSPDRPSSPIRPVPSGRRASSASAPASTATPADLGYRQLAAKPRRSFQHRHRQARVFEQERGREPRDPPPTTATRRWSRPPSWLTAAPLARPVRLHPRDVGARFTAITSRHRLSSSPGTAARTGASQVHENATFSPGAAFCGGAILFAGCLLLASCSSGSIRLPRRPPSGLRVPCRALGEGPGVPSTAPWQLVSRSRPARRRHSPPLARASSIPRA